MRLFLFRVWAFLRHAWATPFTTFTVLGAVCTFLAGDLADGKPFSALKAVKILGGFFAILAGMAMPEGGPPPSLPPAAKEPR